MNVTMMVSLVLIGLAAVVAGGVGVLLPPGDRLSAALPLVVGAGVGVITLAIGTQVVEETEDAYETVFLTGSCLGFLATCSSLLLLWARTRRGADLRRPVDP